MPMVRHYLLLMRSTVFLFFGVPCSGALGSWGAALLAPYSDKPDSMGIMLNSPEILETLVRQFWKDGWQTVRRMVLLVGHRLIDI
jgi:predicted amidohydrolase YtcJ